MCEEKTITGMRKVQIERKVTVDTRQRILMLEKAKINTLSGSLGTHKIKTRYEGKVASYDWNMAAMILPSQRRPYSE